MRFRAVATLCALAGAGLVSTACDAFATYTIDNKTDQPLITRGVMEEDCSQTGGLGSDYLEERSVPPNTAVDIEYVYGGAIDSVSCVQVLTSDRRLVLAEPYREDRTYTIDSIQTGGEATADPLTLPEHRDLGQLKEDLWEHPAQTIGILVILLIGLAFVVAIPLGVLASCFVIGRDVFNRYTKHRHT